MTFGENTFYLDFVQEGEEGKPSLMIVNGMTYLVSKSSFGYAQLKDVKDKMNQNTLILAKRYT